MQTSVGVLHPVWVLQASRATSLRGHGLRGRPRRKAASGDLTRAGLRKGFSKTHTTPRGCTWPTLIVDPPTGGTTQCPLRASGLLLVTGTDDTWPPLGVVDMWVRCGARDRHSESLELCSLSQALSPFLWVAFTRPNSALQMASLALSTAAWPGQRW